MNHTSMDLVEIFGDQLYPNNKYIRLNFKRGNRLKDANK